MSRKPIAFVKLEWKLFLVINFSDFSLSTLYYCIVSDIQILVSDPQILVASLHVLIVEDSMSLLDNKAIPMSLLQVCIIGDWRDRIVQ